MTLVWKPGYSFDSDASTYIDAVETADGQALETGVRVAINDFVLGCKQDEIWDAINACCILAGARTLDGALVPLVGVAPTNFNFLDADYDRETGLIGDGSTKYLDSNRASNADPQNNAHWAVFPTSLGANGKNIIGNSFARVAADYNGFYFDQAPNVSAIRSRSGAGSNTDQGLFVTYLPSFLIGASRQSSSVFLQRYNGTSRSASQVSYTPNADNYHIFQANRPAPSTNARLAFYSIGESLDLAALDTRVSNLITAIGAAIP
jgi:hypothetical protein